MNSLKRVPSKLEGKLMNTLVPGHIVSRLGPQGISLATVHTDKFLPWSYLKTNRIASGASQYEGVIQCN